MPRVEKNPYYDSTHLDIWQRAAVGPVRLQPLTREAAIALRHKLYRLRHRLQNNGSPLAETVQKASIKMYPMQTDRGVHWELLVCPSDTDFVAAYVNAGVLKDEDPPELE